MVFASSVFAAWAVDIAAHLNVLHRLVLGYQTQGSSRDYLYLLAAETQVALFVGVAGLVIALGLARVLRRVNVTGHGTLSSAALLSGVVMLADRHITWNRTPSHDPLAFSAVGYLLAAAVATAVWVVLYFSARWERDSSWGPERVFVHIACPTVLVGFINLAVSQFGSRPLPINMTAAIFLLVVLAVVLRFRSRIVRLTVTALMLLGALWLVFAAVGNNAAFGTTSDRTRGAGGPKQPSIVLIVMDTVRADHLDLFGYQRNTMPRLRSWAAGATVFERAVAAAGWTAPSHASMFSGMPVSEHGIHYSAGEAFETPAKKGIRWLPQKLAAQGYYCLAVSSNPLALPKAVKGFEQSFIPRRHPWYTSTIASLADQYSPLMQRINERGRWRLQYMCADDVVATVQRATPAGDGSVFLFVNFLDAHSPFNPPESALESLGLSPLHIFNRYSNHRELTLTWDEFSGKATQVVTDLYDGELRGMDGPLERLLGWVDSRFGKDTVIIVTADHGEELGEDGRVGHEFGLAQSVVHVPLIIRCPWFDSGRRPEIVTTRSLERFIDSVGRGEQPSIDLLEQPDQFGVISERYASSYNIEHLGPEYNRNWISLFEGTYKAVGPSVNGFELFDINSSGFDHEEIAFDTTAGDHLRQRIDDYWESTFDRREKDIKFEPASQEELKRLRALGYIK